MLDAFKNNKKLTRFVASLGAGVTALCGVPTMDTDALAQKPTTSIVQKALQTLSPAKAEAMETIEADIHRPFLGELFNLFGIFNPHVPDTVQLVGQGHNKGIFRDGNNLVLVSVRAKQHKMIFEIRDIQEATLYRDELSAEISTLEALSRMERNRGTYYYSQGLGREISEKRSTFYGVRTGVRNLEKLNQQLTYPRSAFESQKATQTLYTLPQLQTLKDYLRRPADKNRTNTPPANHYN